jgi:hypothetical protein
LLNLCAALSRPVLPQDTRHVQSCNLDSAYARTVRWSAQSLQRDKQLADWLANSTVNEAFAAFAGAGTGPANEDDPTAAMAHEGFFLALVDGLATADVAARLAALGQDDPIAIIQADLAEQFRWAGPCMLHLWVA